MTDELTWERAVELPPGAICTKLALTDSKLLLATSGGGYWVDLDGNWENDLVFEGPVLASSALAEFDLGAGRFVAHASEPTAPGTITLLSADGQVLDTLESEYPLGFSLSGKTIDVLERQREPCGSSLRRFDVSQGAFAETSALELERTGALCSGGSVPILTPAKAKDRMLAGLHAKFVDMSQEPAQPLTHSQHGSFERVLVDDSGRTYAQGPFSHRELIIDEQDGTLSTQEGGGMTSPLKVSPLRGFVTPQRGFLMGTVGSHVSVDENKDAQRTLLIDRLPSRDLNSPGELPLQLISAPGALGSWCGRVVNAFAEDDVDHSWQIALTQLNPTHDSRSQHRPTPSRSTSPLNCPALAHFF